MPAVALLVSGGHTELVRVKDFGVYEIIGRTRDDAVGEAFDKVARMLGLPYPGGPQISKLAEISRGERDASLTFPRPMINSGDLDFSFSGLKTAVLYKLKAMDKINEETKKEVARAFEDAAVEVLVDKTRQALSKLNETKTLILAGGVSSNSHLRKELEEMMKNEFPNIQLRIPEKSLTTDNAIMIGIAAFIKIDRKPETLGGGSAIKARGNLALISWS